EHDGLQWIGNIEGRKAAVVRIGDDEQIADGEDRIHAGDAELRRRDGVRRTVSVGEVRMSRIGAVDDVDSRAGAGDVDDAAALPEYPPGRGRIVPTGEP